MGLSSCLSRPSRRATARATSASPAAGLHAERAPRLGSPPRHRVLVLGREPEQEAAPGAMVRMVVCAEIPIPRVTRARHHDFHRLNPIHYSVNVNWDEFPQYHREPLPAASDAVALNGLAETSEAVSETSVKESAETSGQLAGGCGKPPELRV